MNLVFFIYLFLISSLWGIDLTIEEKKIFVNGKESTFFALSQPNGNLGATFKKGENFNVVLKNNLDIPSSIHWHGLILPNDQDGVAFITQYPLYPKESYHYQFPLFQSGTYWMHAHYGLEEQKLLAAPLIILSPEDEKIADREVVLFLSDFSFTPPSVIYENLRCRNYTKERLSPGYNINTPDLVDVHYDAFLANLRTLENPEIIEVKSGEKVRLRIINGAAATNFFIDMGKISGKAIAVDGNKIQPVEDAIFELSTAQRIDILLTIPDEGAFPILAIGEGTNMQTGIILATNGSKIPQVSERLTKKAGAFNQHQEEKFRALAPLPPRPIDRQLLVELGGNMRTYTWTINGQSWPESTPLIVKEGERVELIFKNKTAMSHPMHFHGHVFQITSIDGKKIDGAVRDTVLVMPNSTISAQFDANNPGVWPLHCHILYHLEAGMFTVVRYAGFIQPLLNTQKKEN